MKKVEEYVREIELMMPDIVDKLSNEEIASAIRISYDAVLNRLYPFDLTKTEIPERYISAMLQIAVVLINKKGVEGQTSHKEGSVSQTFESSDIPDSMLKRLPTFAATTIKR